MPNHILKIQGGGFGSMTAPRVETTGHFRLAKGGYVYIRRVVGMPEIIVRDERKTAKDKAVRTITYRDRMFEKASDAIAAWKTDRGIVT